MTNSNTDPFAQTQEPNYLAELVGEGKKFKTVDDLAKGKWNSDSMIETLKAEIATLKTQAASGANVDTLLAEIRKINGNKEGTDPGSGQPPVTEQTNTNPVNIEEVVLNTLKKTEAERLTKTNRDTVIAKMNEVWGKDSPTKLQEVAAQLNVSTEYLRGVADQSPSVFFQLTGLNQTRVVPSGTTVPTSTVRPGINGAKDRTMAFYRELKKTNPSQYKSTEIQVQMHNDAIRLGEAFFD